MHHKNILILVLIALFALFFALTMFATENQEEFQKVLPLSSKGTFGLKNVNGRVTIATWKEEKVEIKALKKTNKDPENLQKVKIEVTVTPDAVLVDTVYPKHGNTGVSVDYEVKVPEGIQVSEVSNVNGGVHLTGPFGKASASAVNGQVYIENASGDLSLETTNGDVEAVSVKGRINANTINGSIKLDLLSLEGNVHAETVNGGITLRLSAPQEINGHLEAQTVNGEINFDFPIMLQSLEQTKHRLRGQIGQGGPQISLETVNGSIHLTK
jgi:DUF4097 and DUF4098 domain-containing protein YvlB